jgi:hypothetical protein
MPALNMTMPRNIKKTGEEKYFKIPRANIRAPKIIQIKVGDIILFFFILPPCSFHPFII